MTTFRPSEPRAPLPILGMMAVLLVLSGCASRRGNTDRYRGPPEFRERVLAAQAAAVRDLRAWHGVDIRNETPRVRLVLVPATGRDSEGQPLIDYPGLEYDRVRAYYVRDTQTIFASRGVSQRTLVHEAGHNVLYSNGHGGDHHSVYRKFFSRY
jgi:hypothetical protein